MKLDFLFIIFFCVVLFDKRKEVTAARILCIFQLGAPSHHQTFKPIAKALSLRGHEVVSFTPLPINDPSLTNLTEIDLSVLPYGEILGDKFEFHWSKEKPIYTRITKILSLFDGIADAILSFEPLRKIYDNENHNFDVIIMQTYINPTLYALGAKLNIPVIGVSSMGLWSGSHFAAGNPNPPAIYSEMYLPYNGDLSFWERIKSTCYFLWSRYYMYFVALPKADATARKYLGSDLPYLADIERNVSALFMNINPIFYTPRPLVPTVIPLSFLHIEPPKPLPGDIQKEMDNAKNGVAYFSLGSTVKGQNIPNEITKLFMSAMGELPYKVLWKFENKKLPATKPANVIVRPWYPQQDVLAHPKIKIFVTQCGLQSFEEAVDREVPMVCIPFISDQELNSAKLTKLGVIKQIDYLNTTKEELVSTILEVANNPIYRQRVKNIRKLLQDEPMTGIEKAVWWVEYVIRHKGTRHLHSPTADIPWHQFLLLDVFAVLIGIPLLALIILIKIVNIVLGRKQQPKKEKAKKH